MPTGANEPYVVWGSCFLWHVSIVTIVWSLLLFVCVNEVLHITGTDMIITLVLMSGLLMLPTNTRMISDIARGNLIGHETKVVCCPLWICIVVIIIINFGGVLLCMHKLIVPQHTTYEKLNDLIKNYKTIPKYKKIIDNIQWSLRCCGMQSYKDWFDCDWYDLLRDFEWDPTTKNRRSQSLTTVGPLSDSVPLSCCKSGSCISNYLQELGTSSINTRGCGQVTYTLFLAFMLFHLSMFLLVIIIEINLLKIVLADAERVCVEPEGISAQISRTSPGRTSPTTTPPNTQNRSSLSSGVESNKVKHIMMMKSNYNASSASFQLVPDDSISEELEKVQVVRRSLTARHIGDATTSEMHRYTGIRRF